MSKANKPVHPVERASQVPGMTLREHYSGLAMQALLSVHDMQGIWTGDVEAAAKHAVIQADALIAELERTA